MRKLISITAVALLITGTLAVRKAKKMSTVAKSLKALSQAQAAKFEYPYQGVGTWRDDEGNYYTGDDQGTYRYYDIDGSYYYNSSYGETSYDNKTGEYI